MKCCEVCGGLGCNTALVMCGACSGTGMICLGHESAARYDEMIARAREKAARLGWTEEVWFGGRKIRRLIGPVPQKASA